MLIHIWKWPERLHVERFDPWISYVAVVLFAMLTRRYVEKPGQQLVSGWWKRRRQERISEQETVALPVAKADPVAP